MKGRPMRSRPHGGFTLIELMIAVSLGMMIVMVAMAGFRVTSQAMTAAQRMARMNEIIGIGVVTALHEADYWDSYDDRLDTTAGFSRQRLRQSMALPAASVDGTTRLGLPFSPFTGTGSHTASWPSTTYGRGWKDDERLWAISADNELTWWTAHKAETQESDARFGHYSIFGVSRLPGRDQVVIDPTTDKGFHGGWMPRNGGSFYGTIAMTQPDIPDLPGNAGTGFAALRHSNPGWLFNQLRGLSNSLGWYGMFDYLPANAIVCYTMERSGRGRAGSSTHMTDYGSRYVNCPADVTDTGGRPIFMVKTFSKRDAGWQFPDKPYFVLQSFSPNWAPHGIDFLTSYSAYGLIPPNGNRLENVAGGAAIPLDQMCFYNRSVTRMESHDIPIGDWGANVSNDILEPRYPDAQEIAGPTVYSNFVNRTTARSQLMEQRPQLWPDVSVSVSRYLRLCRFSGQFKVSWTDPYTGEQADLRFTAMGTTLRGARRMRGLDGTVAQ